MCDTRTNILTRGLVAPLLLLQRIQHLPAIEITVQGQKVTALIDSGNLVPRIVIAAQLAPKLITTIYPSVIVQARTACNSYEFKEAKMLGIISVGTYIFPSPIVTWSPDYQLNNLGSFFLQNFAVTFDQKNNRVRLSNKFTPSVVP